MNPEVLQEVFSWLNNAFANGDVLPDSDSIPSAEDSYHMLARRIDREPAVRRALDEAFRALILEKRRFQIADPDSLRLAWDRIVEARHFAEFLLNNGFLASDHTTESLKQFLLIDYWATHGVVRLRDRLRNW